MDDVLSPSTDEDSILVCEYKIDGGGVTGDLERVDGRTLQQMVLENPAVLAADDKPADVVVGVLGEPELDNIVIVLVACVFSEELARFDVEERHGTVEAREEADVGVLGEAALRERRRVGEYDSAEALTVVQVPDAPSDPRLRIALVTGGETDGAVVGDVDGGDCGGVREDVVDRLLRPRVPREDRLVLARRHHEAVLPVPLHAQHVLGSAESTSRWPVRLPDGFCFSTSNRVTLRPLVTHRVFERYQQWSTILNLLSVLISAFKVRLSLLRIDTIPSSNPIETNCSECSLIDEMLLCCSNSILFSNFIGFLN